MPRIPPLSLRHRMVGRRCRADANGSTFVQSRDQTVRMERFTRQAPDVQTPLPPFRRGGSRDLQGCGISFRCVTESVGRRYRADANGSTFVQSRDQTVRMERFTRQAPDVQTPLPPFRRGGSRDLQGCGISFRCVTESVGRRYRADANGSTFVRSRDQTVRMERFTRHARDVQTPPPPFRRGGSRDLRELTDDRALGLITGTELRKR